MSQEQASNRTDLSQFNSSPTLKSAATWTGGPTLVHQNVTLLDCVNETVLEEALAATDLKQAVVRRLTPSSVIIDSAKADELVKALTKRGYEPKLVIFDPPKEKKPNIR